MCVEEDRKAAADLEMQAGEDMNSVSDPEMAGLEDHETCTGRSGKPKNEKHVYPAILLGFGALSPEQIRRGGELLAKAWNIPEC
jgi:hypothetical protein